MLSFKNRSIDLSLAVTCTHDPVTWCGVDANALKKQLRPLPLNEVALSGELMEQGDTHFFF